MSGISNGQVLQWVSANNRFEPVTPSAGGGGSDSRLLIGLRSARPAANVNSGNLYFATDTGEVFYSNGSAWSYMEGARNAACTVGRTTGSAWQIIGNAFTTLDIGGSGASIFDPGSNFNSSTHIYTVPVNGIYQIVSKLRIADGAANRISYGQGVHTSNVDGPWFLWGWTTDVAAGQQNRNGLMNIRIAPFNAGDALRLYAWGGSVLDVTAAELSIMLVSPQ